MTSTAILRAIRTAVKGCQDEILRQQVAAASNGEINGLLRAHLLEYLMKSYKGLADAKAEITFYLELLEDEIHDDN